MTRKSGIRSQELGPQFSFISSCISCELAYHKRVKFRAKLCFTLTFLVLRVSMEWGKGDRSGRVSSFFKRCHLLPTKVGEPCRMDTLSAVAVRLTTPLSLQWRLLARASWTNRGFMGSSGRGRGKIKVSHRLLVNLVKHWYFCSLRKMGFPFVSQVLNICGDLERSLLPFAVKEMKETLQ